MKSKNVMEGIKIITIFGLGMLSMKKLIEIGMREYIKKNYPDHTKYTDNEIIQKYYEDLTNRRK